MSSFQEAQTEMDGTWRRPVVGIDSTDGRRGHGDRGGHGNW